MEVITSWERKGRAEGLREGLREGQRLVVERMLTRRFGALPSGVRERLATLTTDELTALAGAPLSGAQRRLIGQFVDIYLPLNAREEQALAAEVARLPGAAKEVVMG